MNLYKKAKQKSNFSNIQWIKHIHYLTIAILHLPSKWIQLVSEGLPTMFKINIKIIIRAQLKINSPHAGIEISTVAIFRVKTCTPQV